MVDSLDDLTKEMSPSRSLLQIFDEYLLKKSFKNDLPNAKTHMIFGKHYGLPFEQVPIEYIYWLWQQDFVKARQPALYKYCCDCEKAECFDDMEDDYDERSYRTEWMNWFFDSD